MKKISKMSEAAWLFYTVVCALGVVLCTKADFGLSMIAAPPYILHVAISPYLPIFTQGFSQTVWQIFLLAVLCVAVKRVKWKYLWCLAASFLSGLAVDGWLLVFGGNGAYESMMLRVVAFAFGEVCIAFAVAAIFRTYVPPQICELVVTEIADAYSLDVSKVKLSNDLLFFVVSIALALSLTDNVAGIGIGTLLTTVVNAPLIHFFGKLLDKAFVFDEAFPRLKAFFSK